MKNDKVMISTKNIQQFKWGLVLVTFLPLSKSIIAYAFICLDKKRKYRYEESKYNLKLQPNWNERRKSRQFCLLDIIQTDTFRKHETRMKF